MNRNVKRLALALVISTTCFAATEAWYRAGKAVDRGKQVAVASIGETSNEVQRKPVKRVIWENVSKNEELYAGEAIRTSANAEAQILVTKNGTQIRLEPDSLIVLEENDKGLSLDFLQGNMQVAGAGDLTVKTGSGEIKLKGAEMTLGKNKSGEVNLEMFKGEAELQQGAQKVAIDKNKGATFSEKGLSVANDRLQVLFPEAGSSVLLNLSKGEKVEVSWQALAPGYTVSLDTGKNRNQMGRVASAPGETGKLSYTAKPGKQFLRLSAESTDANLPKLASVTIPFNVDPKTPPSLLEPAAKSAHLKRDQNEPVAFGWLNRHTFKSQILEISSDPSFKTPQIRQDLGGEENSFIADLNDGAYYWRVTGYLDVKGKTEALSSPASTFSVVSNWEVKPPTLTSPMHQQRLSFIEIQRTMGVNLKWQAPQGVKRFHLIVEKKQESGAMKPVLDKKVEAPVAKLLEPTPGTYVWKVASIDPKNDSEKMSEAAEFTIDELPPLEWTETHPNNEYEFSTATPTLRASWKPLTIAPAAYRYRVVAEGQSIQDGKWQTTKLTTLDVPLPAEGRYLASVEAVNAKNEAIAASDTRMFLIKAKPLLPAPKWAENVPDVLKSDNKGNLSFGWEEVEGAKDYLLILENEEGKVIEQKKVTRTTASLNRLKPGEYSVKLKAVDTFQRAGNSGEVRKLTVPNLSNIRAPKIKSMKVK